MGNRQEHIDHEVRKRLAEVMSSAGVSHHRVSLEVLYLLPPEFVDAYIQLYYQAFRDDLAVNIGDPDQVAVKDNRQGQKRGSGKAAGGSKKYRTHWQIKDDKAFGRKQSIDRELRKLAKRMRGGEDYRDHAQRRCAGCGKWTELKWAWCAHCGWQLKDG